MEAWVKSLLQHRAGIWGGCGVLLCCRGGCLRYTSLFFPLLQLSDAGDADRLLGHMSRALSALALRPAAVHPAIWTVAQGLMLEILMRAVHGPALLEIALGGVAACTSIWLAEVPGDFVAIGGLYPRLRRARGAAVGQLRRCGSQLALLPLQAWGGASLEAWRVADHLGQQLALTWAAWLFVRFDWVVAVVCNAVLGAELLQRAGREALPGALAASRASRLTLDSCCLATGAWGLARQLRATSRVAKLPPSLAGTLLWALPGSTPEDVPESTGTWRRVLDSLDLVLLL